MINFANVLEFNSKIHNLVKEENPDPATLMTSFAMMFETAALAFLDSSNFNKEVRDTLIELSDKIGDTINIAYLKHAKKHERD